MVPRIGPVVEDAILQDFIRDAVGKGQAGAFHQVREVEAVQAPAPDQAGLDT